MIALLLAVAAQAAPANPPSAAPALGPIGRQQLPEKGCAAYLWSAADRQLVAMATADPATIRIAIGGKTVDLSRSGGAGPGKLGFSDAIEYRRDDITARLTMEVVQQDGLTAGAKVPTGSLQIDRTGQDGIVVPVAGLIGCRA
ncbi:hypothetical protein FHT00_001405 [Sphingomonas insulae]|uniref:Uncharacterized protein n=1 Tax=Sphingomonas insulae TaxID=424800 RepID=A0ABN1HYV2_9SPHN|nr:hypothetical protein [Sphingomonas insulae]NIJ29458.1 hypothetical protein [Sphingomonas insulae]